MNNRPKTLFVDIDGTLIKSFGNLSCQMLTQPELLEDTIETLNVWERKGYRIILTTGRKESSREMTEKQLTELGIFYDALIMGIGGGDRYIINDRKPDSDLDTCHAINLTRNQGIKDLKHI
jgi:hypothetical protein